MRLQRLFSLSYCQNEGNIERVNELARAAVQNTVEKSGNHFFQTLLTRTNKILESTVTNVEEVSAS